MRLRMRTLVGLTVAVAPLLTSVSCCWLCKPLVHGDIVSDVSKGRGLVKILVTLADKDGKCSASVDPEHVVVFRGSAIRWRVVNHCTNPPAKHLTFTQPQPTTKGKVGDYGEPKPWKYRFCTGTIAALAGGNDEKNVMLCEVPEDVVPAHYKYGLDGAAKLDPDIEVHKGG